MWEQRYQEVYLSKQISESGFALKKTNQIKGCLWDLSGLFFSVLAVIAFQIIQKRLFETGTSLVG